MVLTFGRLFPLSATTSKVYKEDASQRSHVHPRAINSRFQPIHNGQLPLYIHFSHLSSYKSIIMHAYAQLLAIAMAKMALGESLASYQTTRDNSPVGKDTSPNTTWTVVRKTNFWV